MATLDTPEPVNLVRSIFLCNIFTFFFSASKACLIPFLTVYMKMLGLSATQTGLVIGAKTLIGLLFAPLWSRCAVRCGKRRCMLMFSLFVMVVTYLSLSAVPSIDESAFATHCKAPLEQLHLNLSEPAAVGSTASSILASSNTTSNNSTLIAGLSSNITNSTQFDSGGSSISAIVASPAVPKPGTTPRPSSTSTDDDDPEFAELLRQVLHDVGYNKQDLEAASKEQLVKQIGVLLNNPNGQEELIKALAKLPTDKMAKLMGYLDTDSRIKRETASETPEHLSTFASLKKAILEKVESIKDHIRKTKNEVCAIVLVILLVGESISCCIEKIADDGWFEFLERIDDMEKYGMHRIWSSLAFILLPVIVTFTVDNTACLFGASIHPFMLHFYLSAAFLGLTFIFAFFYPMATDEKYKYANKVSKGIEVICCNGRSLMFTFTLIVMGVVYATYYNFLFWQLIDMGSKEITMGMCLFVASLAEIPMLLFSSKLVKKVGNGGVVCLALLIMAARCVYYSFLPTPWAVLPAEVTHAFTHTAVWWAILSSPTFNTTHALSRSIRSILSSLYFGAGFAMGSIVSGVIYDMYGSTILFQAGAVLAVSWFPILGLSVLCCREKDKAEVKYARLLTSDASDSDDMEEDWLEQALKDK